MVICDSLSQRITMDFIFRWTTTTLLIAEYIEWSVATTVIQLTQCALKCWMSVSIRCYRKFVIQINFFFSFSPNAPIWRLFHLDSFFFLLCKNTELWRCVVFFFTFGANAIGANSRGSSKILLSRYTANDGTWGLVHWTRTPYASLFQFHLSRRRLGSR